MWGCSISPSQICSKHQSSGTEKQLPEGTSHSWGNPEHVRACRGQREHAGDSEGVGICAWS